MPHDGECEAEAASEEAYADVNVHYQLKALYEEMGETARAAEEQRQIEEFQQTSPAPMPMPMSMPAG